MRCSDGLPLLLLVVLAVGTLGSGLKINRQRRQATQCQPGDISCEKCSKSCSSVEVSLLPECCEAYNTCCDEYFQACKKCSSITAKDQYFPEYCCASFTDCCHLITTFSTQVKPPEPVRTPAKSASLNIPTVAAPKPVRFPGLKSSEPGRPKSQSAATLDNAKVSQPGAPKSQFSPTLHDNEGAASEAKDTAVFDAFQPPEIEPEVVKPALSQPPVSRPPVSRPPVSQAPVSQAPVSQAPAQRGRKAPPQARAQPRPRQRQQGGRRPAQDLGDRRGRITSRGRVIS
ncbi:probable serine/threonine-protein kinase samkC [Procambarus clarkii]|uniref:probable serine/threonine-protein kinase samkC n=1 Tax=Procambarus clarkii TaxID=6728 RepID=UPI001E673A46|nr:protein transport protein SEC24-like [Procambarus clarkii]